MTRPPEHQNISPRMHPTCKSEQRVESISTSPQTTPAKLLKSSRTVNLVWGICAAGALALACMVLFLSASPEYSPPEQERPAGVLGAGWNQSSGEADTEHVVQEGENLSEIAYRYGTSAKALMEYNKLANPDHLRTDQILLIPSRLHADSLLKPGTPALPAAATANLSAPGKKQANTESPKEVSQVSNIPSAALATHPAVKKLEIVATRESDGQGITSHFTVNTPKGVELESWEWNLGNGKKSFRKDAFWTYEQPGTYTVSLVARASDGTTYRSDPLYLDVPHPSNTPGDQPRFITLGSLQESLVLEGTLASVNGISDPAAMPLVLESEEGLQKRYRPLKTGYFNIKTLNQDGEEDTYLYVSPLPSVQVENPSLNWYRTQFNTGTLSNCGPASVAMAVAWAKSTYLSVASVRQTVGWRGDGGTSFEELRGALDAQGVQEQLVSIKSARDLQAILDEGSIAIVLIHTSKITRSSASPARDPFGRYYSDSVGHYVVVKGYSRDGKYFVVHDPVPSDWGANSFRHPDGISMMGRNRYYPSADIIRGLRSTQVIQIFR